MEIEKSQYICRNIKQIQATDSYERVHNVQNANTIYNVKLEM